MKIEKGIKAICLITFSILLLMLFLMLPLMGELVNPSVKVYKVYFDYCDVLLVALFTLIFGLMTGYMLGKNGS